MKFRIEQVNCFDCNKECVFRTKECTTLLVELPLFLNHSGRLARDKKQYLTYLKQILFWGHILYPALIRRYGMKLRKI